MKFSRGSQAAMLVLFHKRICGPLGNKLVSSPPTPKSAAKIETAYQRADAAIQNLVNLVVA
jgi:HD-like signal output (HDOD) protein